MSFQRWIPWTAVVRGTPSAAAAAGPATLGADSGCGDVPAAVVGGVSSSGDCPASAPDGAWNGGCCHGGGPVAGTNGAARELAKYRLIPWTAAVRWRRVAAISSGEKPPMDGAAEAAAGIVAAVLLDVAISGAVVVGSGGDGAAGDEDMIEPEQSDTRCYGC